jgi:tagatose-6-phosphate ketose/aldose isomerase
LGNPLQALLNLSDHEKTARGLKHTPQEIFRQPATWKKTHQYCLERNPEIGAFLKTAGIGPRGTSSPTVFLVGAGSSDYVGRALAHLLQQRWRCEVYAIPSTDLLPDMDRYLIRGREYLWISFSRSGDSSEGVAVLEKALRSCPQVRHLVVTCSAAGAMAELCSGQNERALALVLGEEVNDRGLAMTSSFSNMVIAGQCLAHSENLDPYGQILECMVQLGDRLIASSSEAASSIAERMLSRACFVGLGALAAVADESALKLLELTAGKIHTMSQSTLGLRHGPMSGIDENTLFVQFLSNDPRRRNYDVDLLQEIGKKNLAGERLIITPGSFENSTTLAEYALCLDLPKDFRDEYRPPLDVMVGQLLGLFASLRAELKPDHPSPNGAISRVVSGVGIYS